MAKQGILRAFLALEAAIFLLAAALHAGLIIAGHGHVQAMTAELIIAAVLVAGFVLVSIYRSRRRAIALGAQMFAMVGTLTGASLVLAGAGPRSMPDYALLGIMAIVLFVGLLWTSRRLSGDTAETLIIGQRE
jgi:hypothetical protein